MKHSWLLLLVFFLSACSNMNPQNSNHITPSTAHIPQDASIATFAGGCFWCIEQAFQGQDGVYEAVSGYAEGKKETAQYNLIAQGQTKHREAAQIYYDPQIISYPQLLDIFWRQIDPTDSGGQFADRGFHYTTAIYTHTPEQNSLAQQSLKALEKSNKHNQLIATKILPYTTFFAAEEEHQNFAQKRSLYYQRYKTGSGRQAYIDQNRD